MLSEVGFFSLKRIALTIESHSEEICNLADCVDFGIAEALPLFIPPTLWACCLKDHFSTLL